MPMVHQEPELYAEVNNVRFYHTYREGVATERTQSVFTTDPNDDFYSGSPSQWQVDSVQLARELTLPKGKAVPVHVLSAGLLEGKIAVHPSQRALSQECAESLDFAAQVLNRYFDNGDVNTAAPRSMIAAMLHHIEARGWDITGELTKALQRYQKERMGQSDEPMQVLYRNRGGVVMVGGEPLDVYIIDSDTTARSSTVILCDPMDAEADVPHHYKWAKCTLQDGRFEDDE